MGTPAFAVPVLAALLGEGYRVVGVYTRPDKATGRSRRVVATPVKEFAKQAGLAVVQPASLRSEQAQHEFASLSPDVVVVAAYGLFLPAATLETPLLGCLNVHPSLLPRHRGASPVTSAILEGDAVSGVTIMKIDEGMDSGPILAFKETSIASAETTADLTTRLFEMGASLLVDVLPKWAKGKISARPQDDTLATITKRLSKEDGGIDWRLDAATLARQVRAYQPWPSSFTRWGGRLLKVIKASALEESPPSGLPPGQVLLLQGGRLGVATGKGVLEVKKLQLEGKRAVEAREFVKGYPEFTRAKIGTAREEVHT